MSHLYLVGFMGAGKSTVARLVSETLGMPCVDLDARIEASAGRSVRDIFAQDGESAFRALEHEQLLALASQSSSVVACGGGVILTDENRSFIKTTGTVVYLHVTVGEAMARVGGAETRPLLAGGGGAMAATLLQARETLYKAVADITVDTVDRTPEQVADEVVAAVQGAFGR